MKYENLIETVIKLGKATFPATSPLGYKIPMVRIGCGKPKVLIVASVHAREHITTTLLNELLARYDGKTAIDYIPVLNIDGVLLATNGSSIVKDEKLRLRLLEYNGGSEDFSLWKANILGVDINVNFDADWGEGEQNVTAPGPENYIGIAPNSETETRLIVETLKNDYPVVAAYHSKGEVIYWGYEHNFRHYHYAKKFADFLGYELTRSEGSAGGLKDYYALNYRGLGITVEVGEDRFSHPYPESELPNLLKKHTGSIELLCKMGEEIAKLHGEGDR
ncbi:MAG TPA: M14 family zinc carboxypeptidase [Clostridia bacterium]|jgi:g-D-glutamyl-meso-diaminopimelate peptidase|nr:M14 family zinc carboxypeptidase [Clostridia bacterium]